MLQTFECIRNLNQKKAFCFSLLHGTISQLQMGAVTSRPQCLPASLVTKMSVALYLFSSRDLVFIGSGLKICENCD